MAKWVDDFLYDPVTDRCLQDNKYASELSIAELDLLHDHNDTEGPLRLELKINSNRFILRYRAMMARLEKEVEESEGDDHYEGIYSSLILETACSLYLAEYPDGEHPEDKVDVTEIHGTDTEHEHSDAASPFKSQPTTDEQERLRIPDGQDDQQNETNSSTHDHDEEGSHGSTSGVTSITRRDVLEATEKEAPSEEGDLERVDVALLLDD